MTQLYPETLGGDTTNHAAIATQGDVYYHPNVPQQHQESVLTTLRVRAVVTKTAINNDDGEGIMNLLEVDIYEQGINEDATIEGYQLFALNYWYELVIGDVVILAKNDANEWFIFDFPKLCFYKQGDTNLSATRIKTSNKGTNPDTLEIDPEIELDSTYIIEQTGDFVIYNYNGTGSSSRWQPGLRSGILFKDSRKYGVILPLQQDYYFPVIVKQNNGSGNVDGDSIHYATWAYDLYAQNDTSYVNKLNLGDALQPKNSAARIVQVSVVQAVDGTVGVAYYDNAGVIQLYDCMELGPQTNCADSGTSDDDDGTW